MSVFAALAQDRLEVHPGGGVSVPLQVRNTGAVVNDYRFEVLGPSAGWAEVEPAVLPLFPGQDGTVTLSWRPPRTPDTHAGRVPFGIRVIPGLQPEESVVEEGILRVAPFYALGVGLVPVTSRGRFVGAHKLVLDNQGNADAAVALAALDPDALLRFRMRPTAFRLKVGTTRTVRLRVHPRRHKIKGHPETRSFQVFASLQGQDPQRVDGVYQQQALVAGWQFKVAVLAVLLLIAALLIPKFRQGSAQTLVNSQIPQPPLPVAATALNGTSIRLTWSNAGQYIFSGYGIQQAGETVASPSASESAHVFTGLTPGTKYCYVIRALDPKNQKDPASVFSPPACATTPSPPPPTTAPAAAKPAPTVIATAPAPAPGAPPAPVPVTAQVLSSTDIKLTWTPQGNPASYVIQDAGQQVATPPGTDSAHVFSGLAPGSTHCYVIWAVLPTGSSPHVGPLCATTIAVPGAVAPAAPPPPTNVTVTSTSNTSLQVSWQDPPGGLATGYQVFENGSLVVAEPAGATGASITGLVAGSNHCYAVRSTAGNLTSAFAPDACATAGGGGAGPANLGVPGLDSFAVSSMSPSEGDGRALVGSTVTYAVVFNVPTSGSPNTVLTVSLPSGMAAKTVPDSPQLSGVPELSYGPIDPALQTDASGGFSGVLTSATVASSGGGSPPGQTVTINFKDLTSTSSGQATGETITVNVPAVVLNTASNTDNASLAAGAQLTWNSGSNSTPILTSTVTVASPQPKAVLSSSGSITITLPNSGTAIWNPYIGLPGGGINCGSIAMPLSLSINSCTSTKVYLTGEMTSGQTVTISFSPPGCPQALIEWVSALPAGQSLPTAQSGQDEALAYARTGPDNLPNNSTSIAPTGPDSDVIQAACTG